ncbi:MAG: cytochrome c [Chitinophagaceae bacterium]|nr:cytochrome c [Chitinophagaceae bacterium]
MKTKSFKSLLASTAGILTIVVVLYACSKGGDTPATPPPAADPCAGKTVTVSGSATAADPCSGGKVSVTASGSTGFTYSIDGGVFQVSSDFSNATVGDHTVSVKDAGGCVQSAKVTVSKAASGPFFAAVRNLLNTNCISCHSGAGAAAGKDWTNDCIVISNKDKIKTRTVDGTPSFMPQGGKLSAADMKIITDWVNAGGRYSD